VPVRQVREFLDSHNIKYVAITHSTAYTAQEIAALTHTKGKDLSKTVIVRLDGKLAMGVVPASHHIDLKLLKECSGARTIGLATEAEFRSSFPGCETGAMPPFGNLYDMRVFIDDSLTHKDEIVFNAGTHNELMRLSYADYERLVAPEVVRFLAERAGAHAA